MTVNQKKVLECLVDKRLRDKADYGSFENNGWMTIRDITSYCGFDNHSITTACLINLTRYKVVVVAEEKMANGTVRKYYRLNPNLSIELTYNIRMNSSWEGDPVILDEINNFRN